MANLREVEGTIKSVRDSLKSKKAGSIKSASEGEIKVLDDMRERLNKALEKLREVIGE